MNLLISSTLTSVVTLTFDIKSCNINQVTPRYKMQLFPKYEANWPSGLEYKPIFGQKISIIYHSLALNSAGINEQHTSSYVRSNTRVAMSNINGSRDCYRLIIPDTTHLDLIFKTSVVS